MAEEPAVPEAKSQATASAEPAMQSGAADTQKQASDQSKKPKPKEGDKFHLKIYSPFKVYYDADTISVSAVNATGPFDILAGHHNFLTLLSPCEIVVRNGGETEEKIRITRGIMHVKADDVVVFLDV